MKKGRITQSSLFLMRALVTKDGVHIAVVAPQKIANTAVLRNNIRRRMYQAVQPIIAAIPDGTHIVVFAKVEAVKANFKDMAADMKSLFVKAKVSV